MSPTTSDPSSVGKKVEENVPKEIRPSFTVLPSWRSPTIQFKDRIVAPENRPPVEEVDAVLRISDGEALELGRIPVSMTIEELRAKARDVFKRYWGS